MDVLDPREVMAKRVQKERYLFCPDGSHMAMYDDQRTYMDGVLRFIKDVNARTF